MKKIVLALGFILTSFATNASYQLGTITDISIGHKGAMVTLDTSNGVDDRSDCSNKTKPLNFLIDFGTPGGKLMFDALVKAKFLKKQIGITGDGICIGDDSEMVKIISKH